MSIDPPTILVVDDDPAMRRVLAHTLAAARMIVEVAATGREGLDKGLKLAPQNGAA